MAEQFTSYSIDNDRAFRTALGRVIESTGDLRIPLRLIALDFYKSQKAIWKLKGPGQYPDLSTKPFRAWWEQGPLKRKYEGGYKEYKRAKYGFVYPILKVTGRLETAATVMNSSENITRIDKTSLALGVNVGKIKYAAIHQSDSPRKKIPLRKFLFIGPEAPKFATSEQKGRLERWLGILNGFLSEKMKVAGQVSGG